MTRNIQLMDCTLRDGGFGLEDAVKNKFSDRYFSNEDICKLGNLFSETGIEIIELGGIEPCNENKEKFAIYHTIEEISERIPKNRSSNQKFAGMYRGPDTFSELIPKWNEELIELPRVILRYSELQKSLDFCSMLADKGYKVCVQPMLTMRYTDEELQMVINACNSMGAYALYFVDSYGYMHEKDVDRVYNIYNNGLNKGIKIGFHAHNNMNLAYSNALNFINISEERDIIVDSCSIGMGQGAGNLQTEIISHYLNINYGKNYDYENILETCEIIEKYSESGLWGYSVERLLPAIHKVAYKYSVALRKQYGLTYVEINRLLSNIPEELRNRYTPENTKKLLEINI